jgi:hypothetical protein
LNSPSPSPQPARDGRAKAYRAGARMAKDRIAREVPLDAAALEAVEASDVIVVSGQYDHVEQVLGALEMPFTPVGRGQLSQVELRREQLLIVNCPGEVPEHDVARIRDFVTIGGSLFTTDWALRNVVERAFPGTVAYNDRPTGDDVVPVEVLDDDNPFLRGVIDGRDEPQWWLEGSSYPIRVLDPERVCVLINSREMGRRYGESPIAVLIRWGEGEVFHMISHYYLQRTEFRSARHAARADSYYAEKGMAVPADLAADIDDLRVGDLESAAGSSRLVANVIAAKRRAAAKAARVEGETARKEADR